MSEYSSESSRSDDPQKAMDPGYVAADEGYQPEFADVEGHKTRRRPEEPDGAEEQDVEGHRKL